MQHSLNRFWIPALMIVGLVSGLLAAPAPVRAGGIDLRTNTAAQDFPDSITFSISATAGDPINRVTLIYGVNAQTCLDRQAHHEMEFKPETFVLLFWKWDLSDSGNLPPGVEVWWQWKIKTEAGDELLSEVKTLTLEDPAFDWKKRERGQVSLLWVEGSDAFGSFLLDTAVSSLERLSRTYGLEPAGSIRLMIYPSTDSMKEAMVYTPDWMGGVAFPEYDIIMTAITPDSPADWTRTVIPHELSHLVFGQRTYNCLGMEAPSWLNEGMAMAAEGPVTPAERQQILSELEKDRVQPLTSIAGSFPAGSHSAEVAYLQSKLVVDFMITQYGKENLGALLDLIKEGEKPNDALRAVYGLDTSSLDLTWRASLGFGTAPEADFSTATPAATGTAIPTMALMQPVQMTATPTATPEASLTPEPSPTGAETTPGGTAVAEAQTTEQGLVASPTAPASRKEGAQKPLARNIVLLVVGLTCAGVIALALIAAVVLWVIRSRR